MNIPHRYLINNGLSEQKKKFYEKLANSYKRAMTEYKKKNSNDYFHKKVINWLFSQNEETRMILCSVENKKYTNTLHDAYSYINQCSKNTIFRIWDEEGGDGEKFKIERTNIDYNNYFNKGEYTDNELLRKSNEFEKIQNSFLNNIVFYQSESPVSDINNYGNYFTLNPEFLRNEDSFKNNCNELSSNHFLSCPIMTKKEIQSKMNILTFELPNWISNDNSENINTGCSCCNPENINEENTNYNNKNKYFYLSQYFLALIEQVLSIRYLLFYANNNLNEIVSSTYLYDLFNKKKLILSYLNHMKIEPKLFYSHFNIADINTKIFYDENIEHFIDEKKNEIKEYDYTDMIDNPDDNKYTAAFEKEKIFVDMVNKYKNDKNEFNKNVINMCMFFPIKKLFTLDDFFLRLIFEKIYEEYSKKICDDLIADEKPKKKKKKKKKNNKEDNNKNDVKSYKNPEINKNNLKNEIKSGININENNIIKNNKIEEKKVKEIKDINNAKIKDEFFKFVKNLIMNELDKGINKINENKNNNNIIIEKKVKNNKKEKGFFLYEPIKKKDKKKTNNKTKNNNNNDNQNKTKNNNINKDNINNNNKDLINNIETSNDNSKSNDNKNIIINNNKSKEYKEDINKNNTNLNISNNISIQSHINSFTLSSSNSSSTSSDSNNYKNNFNIIKPNDQLDNNVFVIHQNPMIISYEKFNKLTEDINTYNKDLESLLNIIRKIKIEIKYHFESIVKKIYNKNSKVEIYGSSTYQLDIESSDLDLSISTKSKLPLNNLEIYLTKNNYNNQYIDINPIYTASIPIIKLELDFLKLNNNKINELYQSLINNDYYKICIKNNFYNNFNKIKVDISINSINYKQIQFIKKGNNKFPQVKPLIKILKKLLILKNMNNSYKGGMGSYCLFLIIYSYLRMHKSFYENNNVDYNYGSLFIGFLFHYVMCIDFKYTIINPCLINPFIISKIPIETIPTIIEPTTMKNAGNNIYKIADVVNALKEIYRDIFIIIKEDKNDDNLIYKLFRKYLENPK